MKDVLEINFRIVVAALQQLHHFFLAGLPEEKGFVPEEVFLERVERIAADAILDACTGSNPRQPGQEEMVKLLKCCYYDTEVDF